MEFAKIVGWLTFLVGVSIILFTLYSSYNIFTGKAEFPEIFKFEEKETKPTEGSTLPGQEEISEIIGQQLKNLLPADTFSTILNLFVWSILAGILILGGAQIANLGIKLIKTN